MQETTEIYDFIVIGSGIGGLSTAVILAKNGFRVLVLEKNHQIGGTLQVFSRDKCVFDTGVHYIGGLNKGENLYSLFNYLEIYNLLKIRKMDEEGFDLIRFPDGKTYKHSQGYDNFIRVLSDSFPDETGAIKSFCSKIQEICLFFPFYNISNNRTDGYFNHPEVLSTSAWDFLSTLSQNERLKNVLLGSGPLYAGDPKTTPLYVVALILNSFILGSYRLIDGGSQVARSLSKVLHQYGGKILKHKQVASATFNPDKSIREVICKDGSSYQAVNYISNIHPQATIEIFGATHFRPAYTKRISQLQNSISAFTLHITLKPESFPYFNHNRYEYFTDSVERSINYDQATWPQVLFVCTPASSKLTHPEGKQHYSESVSIMCYMHEKEVKEWENTFNTIAEPGDRGEKYARFKKEKEDRVINRLEERFPGIKEKILHIHSSTPLTFRDFLNTPSGSMYGVLKNFNKPTETVINPRTHIPNLHLTGQNIIFHGILGSTVSAFVTCFNFIDYNQLISQIKEYEQEI